MTTPEAMSAPAVASKPAPLWEDFIDIFHSPAEVYERRRAANPWPMILIITVVATIIGVLTWNALAPIYETEIRDQFTKAMAKNPQVTADMIDTQVKIQMFTRRWGGVFFPIGALIMALPVWLLGRIVGAKELTYTRSLVVFAWSAIITVVYSLAIGVQGLLMDVSTITTIDKLGFSAARFMDKATASPFVYGVAKSFDVFLIWWVIVMAIGVRVVGRGSKNSTIAFAATWLIVSALLVGAFAVRAAAAGG
jgi:hypothetical protein